MGFGKWLKRATRIRFDNRTLGNLTKNVATGAGTVIGGPAGLALAGAGSALGQAALPGSNLGDILKSGVKGAATAGALNKVGGLAKRALPGPSLPGAGAPPVPSVPSVATSTPTSALDAIEPLPGGDIAGARSLGSKLLDPVRAVGNFAKDNATAVGLGLQGAGELVGAGSENRLRNAEAAALERRADETLYDFEQRKRRDAQLAPLWSALGQTVGSRISAPPIAANPYLPRGG